MSLAPITAAEDVGASARTVSTRAQAGRTTAASAALLLAGATTLAGCSIGAPDSNSSASGPSTQATLSNPAEGAPAELASFYTQQLTWEDCSSGPSSGQCSWLTVPVDYAKPDGETIKLKVFKVPAEDGGSHPALLVNPGGPGGSAVEYAGYAKYIATAKVRHSFDIVGVDPRGVGASNPITCVDGAQQDALLAADPTPDDNAELSAVTTLTKDFGAACQQKYPSLIGHLSTVEAAKDMDIARAALGQSSLNWLGKSYGTFLGATYAGLFPKKVGVMVLDGALAPDLTDEEMNLGQAEGFERATEAYVASCVRKGDCPLGSTTDGAMQKLREFLKQLDSKPLPVSGDARVTQLTEGWGSVGLAQAMYAPEQWDTLTKALRSAIDDNDGTPLMVLADAYAQRNNNGDYSGNMLQALPAVNCLDRGAKPTTAAEQARLMKEFTAKAPTWGPFMVNGSLTCTTWPVKATGAAQKITAAGSAPILVVGTTRDPATPYEWAVKLADELENGHLLTRDGDGHTGYFMGNTCIDNAVDAYFLNGTVPADGTKC